MNNSSVRIDCFTYELDGHEWPVHVVYKNWEKEGVEGEPPNEMVSFRVDSFTHHFMNIGLDEALSRLSERLRANNSARPYQITCTISRFYDEFIVNSALTLKEENQEHVERIAKIIFDADRLSGQSHCFTDRMGLFSLAVLTDIAELSTEEIVQNLRGKHVLEFFEKLPEPYNRSEPMSCGTERWVGYMKQTLLNSLKVIGLEKR